MGRPARMSKADIETRRISVVRAIESGCKPDDVAEARGLDSSVVYRWWKAYREGGLDALRTKPDRGRPGRAPVVQALDSVTRCIRKAYTVAVEEYGQDAEIVGRIQRLRDELAEARQELEPEKVYA